MSKEEAFQQLQEVLVKNYFANLEFLKHVDEPLFKRVEQLSEAINSGLYKEKYELEFIEEDGEFDIYDNINDIYVYKKEPAKYIKKATNSINFDKKGYFSILESYLYKDKHNIREIDKQTLQENVDSNDLLFKDIKKYKDILKDDTTATKKSYKTIDKFMFIGTLTSRHILSIANKVKAKNYFVHEPNLEIFRLSLFVLDYTILLSNNATVKFSVMDEPTNFEEKIYSFLSLNSWSNHTIKYHTTDFNVKASFETIMNGIITFKPTTFNYNMLLYNVFRNLSQRVNKYRMLSFPLEERLEVFENKPVLYICAGPSLNDNLQWLKEHHEKFFIVTIGAAYKKLLANNIKPQVIFTIDSKYEDLNRLQFDDESCSKIQDCIVLASVNTDQRILDKFNQEKLFLFDVLYTLKENKKPLVGFSVGEVGYRILLELGVEELYLLGTDLAIDQNTGKSHSDIGSSGDIQTFDLNKEEKISGSFSLRDDLIKVKGNFEEYVYTNRAFNNSILFYNKIGQLVKKEYQSIYNLCNHGAYFQNTEPTRVQNIYLNKIDKEKINLIDILNLQSSLGLYESDKANLNLQKNNINELIQLIILYKNKEYTSYFEFKEAAIVINNRLMEISSTGESFIGDIMSNYLSIINPYIDYCFNDTKLKKEAKKVKAISSLWFKEVKNYLEEYLNYLEEIK